MVLSGGVVGVVGVVYPDMSEGYVDPVLLAVGVRVRNVSDLLVDKEPMFDVLI